MAKRKTFVVTKVVRMNFMLSVPMNQPCQAEDIERYLDEGRYVDDVDEGMGEIVSITRTDTRPWKDMY